MTRGMQESLRISSIKLPEGFKWKELEGLEGMFSFEMLDSNTGKATGQFMSYIVRDPYSGTFYGIETTHYNDKKLAAEIEHGIKTMTEHPVYPGVARNNMGLIISEDEANARLNNPDNLANRRPTRLQDEYNKPRPNGPNDDDDQVVSIRPVNNGGRREGDTNVPEVIRSTAALLAQTGESSKEIAQALGISKTSVDQYKEGNTSFGRPSRELRQVLKQNLDIVQEKAINKMLKGIDFIDFDNQEKMAKVSYRDMSHILKNLGDLVDSKIQDEDTDKQTTKLIVYAPTIRTEQHFELIEVKEQL